MANDSDMLRDIEHLRLEGKKKQANALSVLYYNRYIDYNDVKLEKLKVEYENKYNALDNYV